MPQPVPSPFRYMGPFLGLDTTHSPRELSPAYATIARNVIFPEGVIRPRLPLTQIRSVTGGIGEAAEPLALVTARLNGSDYLIEHRSNGKIYANDVDLAIRTGFTPPLRPASFAYANGWLYICGNGHVFRTRGTPETSCVAGLPPPSILPGIINDEYPVAVLYELGDSNAPTGAGNPLTQGKTYEWKVTIYDPVADVESNPSLTGQYTPTDNHTEMRFWARGVHFPQQNARRVYIYRRNVTDGETAWRRTSQGDLDVGNNEVLIHDGEATTLSTLDAGPWSPSKNGVPTADMALYYKGRMFYASFEDIYEGKVFYSGVFHPDHVDPGDYELLPDDGGRVTGMADLAGQAVFLKERSIWVLSGFIETYSNENIAAGTAPPASSHELYRVKTPVNVGCANRDGPNGAIVAGSSPRLYFHGSSGFYEFDGVSVRALEDRIRPTWRAWAGSKREASLAYSMAVDPALQLIYMVNRQDAVIENGQYVARNRIGLIYHYGLAGPDGIGPWSELQPDHAQDEPVSCTSPIHYFPEGNDDADPPDIRGRYSGLVLGTRRGSEGAVLVMSDAEPYGAFPLCEYESGLIAPHDGARVHLYHVKWFHAQGDPAGGLPAIRFGWRTPADERSGEDSAIEQRSLSSGTWWLQRIRRIAQGVFLRLLEPVGSPAPLWKPDIRIVGFEIDAERVGHF